MSVTGMVAGVVSLVPAVLPAFVIAVLAKIVVIVVKRIKIVKVTLHVGLGTFRPVQVDDVTEHKMHTEAYEVSKKAADDLNHIRKTGGRIIAVGTTTVRTLETVMKKYGKFEGCVGETSIFIYPGFEFQAVDAMITNFHLPKSTLLMLVSAFAGKDFIMKAYEHAVKEKYRFFSFGDAMFIERQELTKCDLPRFGGEELK